MEILKRAVLVAALVGPVGAHALDYEAKIKHDKVCMVEAIDSEGEVYLKCKGENAVLKTTVDLPYVSDVMNTTDLKSRAQLDKKIARAKVVWALLDYSFSARDYLLLDFNEDRTLIKKATVFISSSSGKAQSGKKLDL